MYIEPLSYETLDKAINLVDRVFPSSNPLANASWTLRFSLKPSSIIAKIAFYLGGVTEARYWVAVDEKSKEVIGISGLYCCKKDKDEAYWLGWTCVEPNARGQRIGSKLVDFCIDNARSEDKKFLRLYTSTYPELVTAQIMYENKKFRIFGESNIRGTNHKIIYHELELL